MELNKEKGYSAYIFANDTESDYCVIDQEDRYAKLRKYVNIGSMVLIFAIMVAAPITLVAVYDYLCASVKGNMLFFAWSLMLGSCFAACAMLAFDVLTIKYNIHLYPQSPNGIGFHDIFVYFLTFTIILGVVIIFDFVLMVMALLYLRPSQHRILPIPELLNFFRRVLLTPCRLSRKCKGHGRRQLEEKTRLLGTVLSKIQQSCCSECLVLLFGSFFFTLFLQLSSFHFLYIILGAISIPVVSLSISTFYIACFFCFVAFIAIILKSTNNPDYFKWDTLKCMNLNILRCASPFLAAALFAVSLGLFIGYFYNYVIMVQSYSNNGGFLAIIGNILPAVLVGLGGFSGTRLIKCIEDPSTKEQQTQTTSSRNSSPTSERQTLDLQVEEHDPLRSLPAVDEQARDESATQTQVLVDVHEPPPLSAT